MIGFGASFLESTSRPKDDGGPQHLKRVSEQFVSVSATSHDGKTGLPGCLHAYARRRMADAWQYCASVSVSDKLPDFAGHAS
tara:strand:- start:395 stop:640 length:246 start_codon:yes stop_codon:yes gene_type:complete